jgi:hypothetical protein
MSELALEWVPAGAHTPEDLEYIAKADEAQPLLERMPLLQVDHALRNARMQLFRIHPGPGVILTEIRSAYGVKRLCLIRGAGRAAHQIKSILKLLETSRREWGCECIETVVYSHRLKRALELSGATVEGFILRYPSPENADGQQDNK